MATMDVCANATTPPAFCYKEGYDIVLIHMVRVIKEGELRKENNHKDDKAKRNMENPTEKVTIN